MELVAKPLILEVTNVRIFFVYLVDLSSKSDLSFSYLLFKTKFVVLVLFTSLPNPSYSVVLETSFLTTLLNLAKSLGTGTNLSMPNLSISDFKLDRFVFDAKLLTSVCDIFLR